MAAFTIRKAQKHRRKLRLALIGISKSGKTLTALLFARALVGPEGKIGLIDTEGGNSEIYAGAKGVGDFGIAVLNDNNPENYIEALNALIDAGCQVVVIDSLSHAWVGRGGVLEIVDNNAGTNKYTSGWGKGTPLHNNLIAAINNSPAHIIATMRQKAEYALEANEKGKLVPRKVGMAPVQREGMEYEFDITGEMDDTAMTITGIRGQEFEPWKNKTIKKPDGAFIEKIKGLLSDEPAQPPPAPAATPSLQTGNHGPSSGTVGINGTANGASTTPRSERPPASTKAQLWAALSVWTGIPVKQVNDLNDARREVYQFLEIADDGKATEQQMADALKYIREKQTERKDFGEWAAEARDARKRGVAAAKQPAELEIEEDQIPF